MSMRMHVNALAADLRRLRDQEAAGTLTKAHRDQILDGIERRIAGMRREPVAATFVFRNRRKAG